MQPLAESLLVLLPSLVLLWSYLPVGWGIDDEAVALAQPLDEVVEQDGAGPQRSVLLPLDNRDLYEGLEQMAVEREPTGCAAAGCLAHEPAPPVLLRERVDQADQLFPLVR